MMPINKLDEGMLLYIGYQLLSAAVQSLAPPTTESSATYTFVYKFMSLLVADFKSFGQKAQPPTVTTISGQTTSVTQIPPTTTTT